MRRGFACTGLLSGVAVGSGFFFPAPRPPYPPLRHPPPISNRAETRPNPFTRSSRPTAVARSGLDTAAAPRSILRCLRGRPASETGAPRSRPQRESPGRVFPVAWRLSVGPAGAVENRPGIAARRGPQVVMATQWLRRLGRLGRQRRALQAGGGARAGRSCPEMGPGVCSGPFDPGTARRMVRSESMDEVRVCTSGSA